jgi:hypothetical protein
VFGLVFGLLLASSILLLTAAGGSSTSQAAAAAKSGSMPQMPSGMTAGSFPQGGSTVTTGSSTSGQFTAPSGTAPTGMQNTPSTAASSSSAVTKVLGWVFLGGAVLALAAAIFFFLKKKLDVKGSRWMILLLGFVLGALIGASTVLMFALSSSTGGMPQAMNGGNFPATTDSSASASATATTVAESTTAASAASTAATPAAAEGASVSSYELVVCMDPDYRLGYYVYDFPTSDSKVLGSVSSGDCLTINGRSSAYPGWYRIETGQNGMGGIQIYAADTETNLWFNAQNYTDATEENLNNLPDITLTPAN